VPRRWGTDSYETSRAEYAGATRASIARGPGHKNDNEARQHEEQRDGPRGVNRPRGCELSSNPEQSPDQQVQHHPSSQADAVEPRRQPLDSLLGRARLRVHVEPRIAEPVDVSLRRR